MWHLPFSRLHLMDDVGPANPITYAQALGYRDWMRDRLRPDVSGGITYQHVA
jgi:hypothetical protein